MFLSLPPTIHAQSNSVLEVGKQVTPIARAKLGVPVHADWVDRVVGAARGNVSLAGDAGIQTAALRETAFWNSSIAHVYFICRAAFGADFGEQQLTAGTRIPARYAVVPASLEITGRVLARDAQGKLVLVAPTAGVLKVPAPRCGK